MYAERSFQGQLIKNDLNRLKRRYTKPVKKSKFQIVRRKTKKYVVMFLETSSIHGLNHLVTIGRHSCEIFLWLSVVILSVFGTLYLSRTTWLRYQSSPTVVSMDRDMFAWNTTFPSVTLCLDSTIDNNKLENYVRLSNEEDKEQMKVFIKALANATFENFDTMPKYDGIPPEKYLEILLNLSMLFKPTLTIGASGINLDIVPTVTEMGVCYAINSKVAVYNSPEASNRWDIVDSKNSMFFIHPLDGEVFAQVMNITTSYNAYIHGPLEVPDISTKHQHSKERFYMKLYVTALTVYTSPEAASLSIAQRRCRFQHENILKHNSIYSYTMCRMECRVNLCLKYCNCIPYFYRRIGEEKICDVSGLHCLGRYKGNKEL
ncbi:unnamed protein product, partial [Brenthis ino]